MNEEQKRYKLTGKSSLGISLNGKTVIFHRNTEVALSEAEIAEIGKEMALFTAVDPIADIPAGEKQEAATDPEAAVDPITEREPEAGKKSKKK